MFVKHYVLLKCFFVTNVLYNWISQFKIRNSFSKLLLKRFWHI